MYLNPAVTVGLCAARRFAWKDLPGYVGAQVAGGIVAASALVVLLKGQPQGYDAAVSGLAANGFGGHSPGHYGLGAALLVESIMTFLFLTVILGAASKRAVVEFAGIPIGLTLTLVHLVGIPITNVSVNSVHGDDRSLRLPYTTIEHAWRTVPDPTAQIGAIALDPNLNVLYARARSITRMMGAARDQEQGRDGRGQAPIFTALAAHACPFPHDACSRTNALNDIRPPTVASLASGSATPLAHRPAYRLDAYVGDGIRMRRLS
jgi:Major intrinsic protein